VNCCSSTVHQPSSARESVLFTSSTATMPSTSRTTIWTQKMIVVLFPPFDIGPEYLQDHCRCRWWYHFRIISLSATALCTAMFCCASADYDCVENLVSVLYSEYRTVLRLRKIGVFWIRVPRKLCKNRALLLWEILPCMTDSLIQWIVCMTYGDNNLPSMPSWACWSPRINPPPPAGRRRPTILFQFWLARLWFDFIGQLMSYL
jgi:hypothetical protein